MDRRDARLTLPGPTAASVLAAAVVLVVGIGVGVPLWYLVARGGVSLDVLGERRIRAIVVFTVWQAALSAVVTLVAALPLCWALSRWRFRGSGLARAVVVAPFVMPPVVLALAVAVTLPGPRREGVAWLIATHALVNLAVVVRIVGAAWERLDDVERQAARTLGAGPLHALRTVTLPALAQPIASATTVVFLFCLSSFGVAKVVAGPSHPTIEVEIARQALQLLRIDRAAGLGVVQLVVVAATVAVAGLVADRAGRAGVIAPLERPTCVRDRVAVTAAVVPAAALCLVPMAALVWHSFDGGLDTYRSLTRVRAGSGLSGAAIDSVWVSLRFAIVAAAITMTVGSIASMVLASPRRGAGRVVSIATIVPLGASSVLLGLGYLLSRRWAPLREQLLVVPLAHAVIALPLVVRTMAPTLTRIDPDQRAAAALAGCTPRQVWWWVDRPYVMRAAAAGAALAMAVSLGEFGAATFLVRTGSPTVPVAVVRLLGRPGAQNLQAALALSSVLVAMVAVPAAVADRLTRAR